MKKAIVLSTLLMTATLPAAAMAKEASTENLIGVGSGVVIGALLAGPFGAVIGAGLGHKIGDKVNEADQLETTENLLSDANRRLAELQQQLAASENDIQSLKLANAEYSAEQRFEGLQLEVLFQTADIEIPSPTQQRLNELVSFLKANPSISIQLDGYTDERGSKAFNHSLSLQRTNSVEDYLIDNGIEPGRIYSKAHGKQLSQNAGGNPDIQALDRRVSIRLNADQQDDAIASRH